MKTLFEKLINVEAPLLITGPSGCGKSQLARTLFESSGIYKEKFLTLHLASIKEDLFESELFGHRKGAFTGAIENKNGYLKDTGSGTLFLDEIGELSLEAQKKLLYLLEEKKYTPVGSTECCSFKGRIIMATNRDLKTMVKEGFFREDLYYRLSVFHLELKSLAENLDELKKALHDIFMIMKERYQRPGLTLSPELNAILLSYQWKGNYRELKNCLEYMVALSESRVLTPEQLPVWFDRKNICIEKEETFLQSFPRDYNEALERFEELYLREMFVRFSGKVNETARVLGISKTTLIAKARKYRINTMELRAIAHNEKSRDLVA